MDRVVTKYRLGEQPNDFAYWQSQSIQARIDALEDIRREYHRWKYHAEPGFQRILKIAQRE